MKRLLFPLIYISSSLLVTVKAQSFTIKTFAGDGLQGYYGSGVAATSARFYYPSAIAVDDSGNVFIADYDNNRVRKVNTDGIISLFAGKGTVGYTGDGGLATAAEISRPMGVAANDSGIYLSDYDNNCIRRVNVKGVISTFAGNGIAGNSGDGGMATLAEITNPMGIASDGLGNLYIADGLNNCIRKVNIKGIISTIAGNGSAGYFGDGGQATNAELNDPYSIAIDVSGSVYIADDANSCIRKVSPGGVISTIAGNGTAGYSGDGAAATNAELNQPQGLAFDAIGNIYITDHSNQCIRQVNTSGVISTITGNGTKGYSGDGGLATAAELANPSGEIAFDAHGNLYIADQYNERIRMVITGIAGLNNLQIEKAGVSIFPNPSSGIFTIQIEAKNAVANNLLEIYSVLGEKVLSQSIVGSQCQLDLISKPKGVYLYRVLSESGVLISGGRFVID